MHAHTHAHITNQRLSLGIVPIRQKTCFYLHKLFRVLPTQEATNELTLPDTENAVTHMSASLHTQVVTRG